MHVHICCSLERFIVLHISAAVLLNREVAVILEPMLTDLTLATRLQIRLLLLDTAVMAFGGC
jgi:hypothetical protein